MIYLYEVMCSLTRLLSRRRQSSKKIQLVQFAAVGSCRLRTRAFRRHSMPKICWPRAKSSILEDMYFLVASDFQSWRETQNFVKMISAFLISRPANGKRTCGPASSDE